MDPHVLGRIKHEDWMIGLTGANSRASKYGRKLPEFWRRVLGRKKGEKEVIASIKFSGSSGSTGSSDMVISEVSRPLFIHS